MNYNEHGEDSNLEADILLNILRKTYVSMVEETNNLNREENKKIAKTLAEAVEVFERLFILWSENNILDIGDVIIWEKCNAL